MDSYDGIWMLWILILCALHGWYSAAITAVYTLGGQLSGLIEKTPKLEYYQKRKMALQYARPTELIMSVGLLAITFYVYASRNGWIQALITDTTTQPAVWDYIRYLLPGLTALFLTLLIDGLARGVGRKEAVKIAEKSVGFVRTMTTFLLPLRMLYTSVEHLFGGNRPAEGHVTEADILQMVNAGNKNGVIEEQQREMINNIFEFDDMLISEVMTHRTEIVAVDVEAKINDVICLARDENYSRMPVYQENIDNIIGILNTKDLLGLVGCRDISGFYVRHFMRDALFVPETAKCDDVLSDMSHKKMQMAIVVDEYGGTAGVVCMEDILEEIVGNIQDEYDEEEVEIRRVTDKLYTIDGHADPDEVFPVLGLEMPEGMSFGTMSGFVVDLLGRIPETQENPSVVWNHVRFTVLVMEDNWIAKIKAEILPEEKDNREK